MDWNGKPYYSLDYYLKKRFGCKVYKLALDGGMSCPNRDGTLGHGGCIFCSAGGSGDFAQPPGISVTMQIEKAKARVEKKLKKNKPHLYIAYFQSYTNTYAPAEYLEALFTEAIRHPEVAALSIATRPDCLPGSVISLLARLNRQKPVWVELGLQTIHKGTAHFIRRGYSLDCFENACMRLKEAGLETIVHVILGLPGETREMVLDTIRYLGALKWNAQPAVDGIKVQLLHILKGTDLAEYYQSHPFPVLSLNDYADLVVDCIELLPPEIVIHRITGDGPKSLLIAPAWSADKKRVLNTISHRLQERASYQGKGLPHR